MAIDRTPVFKRCRHLGIDPGVIGYSRKPSKRVRPAKARPSAYATQLKEKQKVKYVYGLLERQFRRVFDKAARRSGKTGETLLELLELRLDNAVYRLAWAKTRREARQLVNHGKVSVNGRKADIPSIELKPGDVIRVRAADKAALQARYAAVGRAVPSWLSLDAESMSAEVVAVPDRSGLDFEVEERMIVELYSR